MFIETYKYIKLQKSITNAEKLRYLNGILEAY